MTFHTPRVNNDHIRLAPRRGSAVGRVDGGHIRDGMIVDFGARGMTAGDALLIQDERGHEFDMFFGSVRPDGMVSVWYAVHPEHRHWLGRLERQNGNRWRFRMEPFHRDWLSELRTEFPDVFGPQA